MMFYKENTVFEEAVKRVNMIFDSFDDVIVSMSGGKDSTVLFNIALMVARERGRLPLKVFWLDQEAEWQSTVNYMDMVMHRPDVKPYWFQIPFDFTNSLSGNNNFIHVWNPADKEKWIHPQADISIKENPSNLNRFHDLVAKLPAYCRDSNDKKIAVLVGMRVQESLNRRMAIAHGKAYFKGETWCQKAKKDHQVFWPIYDFTNDDIWTAIAKNNWEYNKVYDYMYQYGVPKSAMRVSALIHETSWHSIELLQEFEQKTYNRFVARVSGVSTFNHAFDEGGIIPRELPFAFRDWKEYRDYLLVHLTQPQYHELFRNRWKGQDGDEWYKVHVKEIIINDIDGTINANAHSRIRKNKLASKDKSQNRYYQRYKKQFDEYMKEKEQKDD